jgi:hypothetical protein
MEEAEAEAGLQWRVEEVASSRGNHLEEEDWIALKKRRKNKC